jgi:hypothetical protein
MGSMKSNEEEKAIKDAEIVSKNAPDEKTKSEATATLAASGSGKADPNPKPAVKSYEISSLKRNPLQSTDKDIEKQRTDEFNKLSAEDKKKYVIKAKVLENQSLDKKDQHEISREDQIFAGLIGVPA